MSPNLEVHIQIKLLLQFSVEMEQLITDCREDISFAPAEATKFAKACEHMLTLHAALANHFAEEETDLFTLTSKCHMPHAPAHLPPCPLCQPPACNLAYY